MKNLISLLLVVGALAGGGWLKYFGPFYLDAYRMEEITESVALTWSAYTKPRAEGELVAQFRDRDIDYITPEHCNLEERGGEFSVSCAWQVDVYPPLIAGRRLDFLVESVASKDRRLVED
ncbi:MAG: hypothetical protein EXR71_11565 [Myxococcales bacterium]|nr:hypothetical protein [Myxococcales bacterium]